jgi:hypothetical protein
MRFLHGCGSGTTLLRRTMEPYFAVMGIAGAWPAKN